MMRSMLEMYVHGSHEGVWCQLMDLGDLEEGTTSWEDAYSVARETMTRARENVERIIAFLRDHGYRFGYNPAPFAEAELPWLPPTPDVAEKLKRLTALVGPLPLSLRAWWEIVGFVSLQGTFYEDFEETDGFSMTDPLMVRSLESVLREAASYHERGQWPAGPIGYDGHPGHLFEIAPDMYSKAKYSGGLPYAVWLPDPRADTALLNVRILLPAPPLNRRSCQEVALDETFLSYLRRSFTWAGFPALSFWHSPEMECIEPLFEQMLPL